MWVVVLIKSAYIIFIIFIIWCLPSFAQQNIPDQMQLADDLVFEGPILTLYEPVVEEAILSLNKPKATGPILTLNEPVEAIFIDEPALGKTIFAPDESFSEEALVSIDKSGLSDTKFVSDRIALGEHNDDPAWFTDALDRSSIKISPSITGSPGFTQTHGTQGEFWTGPEMIVLAGPASKKLTAFGDDTGPANKGTNGKGSGSSGKDSGNKAGSITDKTEELLQNGNRFYDLKSYASAQEYYQMAIDTNPESAELWFNKGNALYKQDKFEESINAYDKAITLDPEFSKAWKNKGFALEALGKTIDAEAAFAKARELESS
jgi:tetratricopeptide (TPR) repeat protein